MFKHVFNWNFLLIIAVAAFFTSCDKDLQEDLTTNDVTDFTIEERADPYEGTRGPGGIHPRGCFDFVFPVTVVFPDGNTAEADNAQLLRQLYREWCQGNENGRPHVQMPFEVIVEDEMTVLIESPEDFQQVVADCLPDGPPFPILRRLCFRPVFPLTVVFPDGTTQEVDNRFQLKMAVRDWVDANPGSDERPELQYPFDVTLQDGSVVTVNSPEDVQALLEECQPDGSNGPCFRPEYPLTVVYPDGNTAEVNNRSELRMAIREWVEANPGSDERPELQYPYNVTLQDGTVVTLESQEDLQALLEECGHDGPNRPCFRPVFPLTIAFPDGTTQEVDKRAEFRMTIRAWVIENPDAEERPTIAFPYELTLQDGTIVTINNQDELDALLEDCED
jgi:hypothetical protein